MVAISQVIVLMSPNLIEAIAVALKRFTKIDNSQEIDYIHDDHEKMNTTTGQKIATSEKEKRGKVS